MAHSDPGRSGAHRAPARSRWRAHDCEWTSEAWSEEGGFFIVLTCVRSCRYERGARIRFHVLGDWLTLTQWLKLELGLLEDGFYEQFQTNF